MSVSADWIAKVMGSPDSVTAKLVSTRRVPGSGQLNTGVWYSGFTRVKSEAEKRGIPFFAVWTNGDVCSFCRRFAENLLAPEFIGYMRRSGGLWWLGGSMDDSQDDMTGGTGFTWCAGPDRSVKYFPFVAVSVVRGGARKEFFRSGSEYDNRRAPPTGAALAVAKLKSLVGVPPAKRATSTQDKSQRDENQQTCAGRTDPPAVKAGGILHIRFNPEWDAAHIARFQSALKENGGHCVCQPDRSPDTMCMCKSFLDQDKPGPCYCGAFEKFTV